MTDWHGLSLLPNTNIAVATTPAKSPLVLNSDQRTASSSALIVSNSKSSPSDCSDEGHDSFEQAVGDLFAGPIRKCMKVMKELDVDDADEEEEDDDVYFGSIADRESVELLSDHLNASRDGQSTANLAPTTTKFVTNSRAPIIRVASTTVGATNQSKSKSMSNIIQTSSSAIIKRKISTSSSLVVAIPNNPNGLKTIDQLLFNKSNVTNTNALSSNATRPLVLNHRTPTTNTSSNIDRTANSQQSENSNRPTLSPQLIISTQAKSQEAAKLKQREPSSTTSSSSPPPIITSNSHDGGLNTFSPTLSSPWSTSTASTSTSTLTTTTAVLTPKTSTIVSGSKSTTPSPCRSTKSSGSGGNVSHRAKTSTSSKQTLTSCSGLTARMSTSSPTTQVSISSATPAHNNVVSARLMDMGKRLLDAVREGQIDHVRQLVVSSGAPFTSDWLGTTALHLAAQYGHTEIAEILLRGGVNRDARTKLERTALHLAAQSGSFEVVDLLLIHGSDVNARDMLRMTPLHWAVERGHISVVERLLLSGADINAKSKFQLSPVDIAQDSELYPEMLVLFEHWSNKNDCLAVSYLDDNNFNESDQDILSMAIDDSAAIAGNRSPTLDIDEPSCIDLVELEWNTLKFEPDFFLSNDDEDEPKVEYLMKIVEELQKENRQLRQKVEQLSTTSQ